MGINRAGRGRLGGLSVGGRDSKSLAWEERGLGSVSRRGSGRFGGLSVGE